MFAVRIRVSIMISILSQSYRVNAPKVVYEAFEDETVLINIDSGNYYSFSGSGALIWDRIVSGESIASVIEYLQERFADAADIALSVEDFVRELVEENLIVKHSIGTAKKYNATKSTNSFARPI